MKSIPIESQGFVGMGSVCSFPEGGRLLVFEVWHASQDLQKVLTSFIIWGHQYQRLRYPDVLLSPKWPTVSCDFYTILVIRSRSRGTHNASSCAAFLTHNRLLKQRKPRWSWGLSRISENSRSFAYPSLMLSRKELSEFWGGTSVVPLARSEEPRVGSSSCRTCNSVP